MRFLKFYEGFRFDKYAAYVKSFFTSRRESSPMNHQQTQYPTDIYEGHTPGFDTGEANQIYGHMGQQDQNMTQFLSTPGTPSLPGWTDMARVSPEDSAEALSDEELIDMAIEAAKDNVLEDPWADDDIQDNDDAYDDTYGEVFQQQSLEDVMENPEDDPRENDMPEEDAPLDNPRDMEDPEDVDPNMLPGPGRNPFLPGG